MKNVKNIPITIFVDDGMDEQINQINLKIEHGAYKIRDFDTFVEISLLIFIKLLENGIEPDEFEEFIKLYTTKPIKVDLMN